MKITLELDTSRDLDVGELLRVATALAPQKEQSVNSLPSLWSQPTSGYMRPLDYAEGVSVSALDACKGGTLQNSQDWSDADIEDYRRSWEGINKDAHSKIQIISSSLGECAKDSDVSLLGGTNHELTSSADIGGETSDAIAAQISDAGHAADVQESTTAATVDKPKRAGRRTSAEKAAQEEATNANRAAEKALMMEAVAALSTRPPRLPEASQAVSTPPPPIPAAVVTAAPPALPGVGSLTPPARTPPQLPAASPGSGALQATPALPGLALPGTSPAPTPALPGAAAVMPVIPEDGGEMSLADLQAVVRLAASNPRATVGTAFAVMKKHGYFNPAAIPPELRAQFAREVAIAAFLIEA